MPAPTQEQTTPEQLRRERAAQIVKALKLDALLVTSLHNVRYLTGFTGSSANVLLFSDGARCCLPIRDTPCNRNSRSIARYASPKVR